MISLCCFDLHFHVFNALEFSLITAIVDAWCTTQIPAAGLRPPLYQLLGVLAVDGSQVGPSPGISLSQRKLLHLR